MDASTYIQPVTSWFERNKVKMAGFAAGAILPIVVSAIVVVTYRGYGWGEDPPQIRQIYTSF